MKTKRQRIKELEAEVATLEAENTRLIDKVEVLTVVEDKTGVLKLSVDNLAGSAGSGLTSADLTPAMRKAGAVFAVDDYYGGKVLEHEATPVTILNSDGKATYSQTKKPADKGFSYRLERLS